MKSVLIYYPFRLSTTANSGSKIRPIKILRAFEIWAKENHIKLHLISGSSQERDRQFHELLKKNELEDLLFCYMENQTIPIWLTDENHIPKKAFIDRKVLKYLKKREVPVGLFYRDVYWKFDELYPLKGVKKKMMKFFYHLEERFYGKYVDTLFLPSLEMGEHVDINIKKEELPPGGQLKKNEIERPEKNYPFDGLYVGAIGNEDYGLFLLLDSIEKVNEKSKLCRLTVVCRKEEYDALPIDKKERITGLNVNVLHISGNELDTLYKKIDIAFIPRYKSVYNDFAVPVKLVEYLSNGIPIVATNCDAQARLIREGNYGVVCDDNKDSMADAIFEAIKNNNEIKKSIMNTFEQKHSWLTRVEQVKKTLIGEKI